MDIKIIENSFDQTIISIQPITEKGKDFFAKQWGKGCNGIAIKRSYLQKFLDYTDTLGLIVR